VPVGYSMARKTFTNRSCPVCVRPVSAQDECENCEACGLSVHAECWASHSGCPSSGCPNNPVVKAAAETVLTEALPTTERAEAVTGAELAKATAPIAPRIPAAEHEERRPLWLRPEGLLVYAAAVLLCATLLLSIWKVKQRQATRVFQAVVAECDTSHDPHSALKMITGYIETHPDNRFTRQAREKLEGIRAGVAEQDSKQAMHAAEAAGERYESAEATLRAYLDTNPASKYREEIERKLLEFPKLIDDRDYAAVDRQYPESGDLVRRQAALEDYLTRHPRGAHVDAARKELAEIPDALDNRRFSNAAGQASTLLAARKWEQAIVLLDGELPAIVSDVRKVKLADLRQQCLAGQESDRLSPILKLPTDSPEALAKLTGECRLFLLCYPHGPAAEKAMQTLKDTGTKLRRAEWSILERELAAHSADSLECLRSIERYRRRWSDPESQRVAQQLAARYHLQLLKSAISEAPPIRTGTLLRTDGKTLSGIIEKKGKLYRITQLPSDKKAKFVGEQLVKAYEPSAEAAASEEIGKRIAGLDAGSVSAATLKPLIAVADKNNLGRHALLLRCAAVELDPNDTESVRALAQAGYVRRNGRWQPADVRSPRERAEAVLGRHRDTILKAAQKLVTGLDLHVTYEQFGITEEIPLSCAVDLTRLEVTDGSVSGEPFEATARALFRLEIRAKASSPVRAAELVKKAAQDGRLEGEVELRSESRESVSLSLQLKTEGGKCLVADVAEFGPADRAGIEAGDEVVDVSGESPGASPERLLDRLAPGTSVTLKLLRNGSSFSVSVPAEQSARSVVKARYRFKHNLGSGGSVKTEDWIDLPDSLLP
jgi:hypothetical protein